MDVATIPISVPLLLSNQRIPSSAVHNRKGNNLFDNLKQDH
jgi:hypothetical protein